MQSSATSSDDSDTCAVCLERACSVAAEGLNHYPFQFDFVQYMNQRDFLKMVITTISHNYVIQERKVQSIHKMNVV